MTREHCVLLGAVKGCWCGCGGIWWGVLPYHLAPLQGAGTRHVVSLRPFSPCWQLRDETGHGVKWRSCAATLHPPALTPCQDVCCGSLTSGMGVLAAQGLLTLPTETQLCKDGGSSTGGCTVPVLGRDILSLFPGSPVSWVIGQLWGKGMCVRCPGRMRSFSVLEAPVLCVWKVLGCPCSVHLCWVVVSGGHRAWSSVFSAHGPGCTSPWGQHWLSLRWLPVSAGGVEGLCAA